MNRKRNKLSKAEILAVQATIRTGLRIRHLATESWFRGYCAGVQGMCYCLPGFRRTVRLTRRWERLGRILKRAVK